MSAEPIFAELPLLLWLSPAFPIGSFAYSHGIETAVEAGLVHDAPSLLDWLRDLLAHGSGRQDCVLAAAGWRAALYGDAEVLVAVNDLALSLCPSRERRLESGTMGRAFADTIRSAWPQATSFPLPASGEVAYPVAFGAACASIGVERPGALAAFAMAFVANLVSAAVRLGPIGQTDAQRVLAALLQETRALGAWAEGSTLDDLGGCAFRSDIAAMQHETLYSRLFRS